MTLSVCLIVKNEEPVLRRCLACAVQFADELIVVDTGSTDNSAAIAREYTPYVYLHPWQNSFAEARNYSYSKATGDYIMWLDADDVVTDENIGKINRLKEEVDNVEFAELQDAVMNMGDEVEEKSFEKAKEREKERTVIDFDAIMKKA